MSTTTPKVRYSGFTRPRAVGLGDMSLPASLFCLFDLIVTFLTWSYVPGWWKAVLALQLVTLFGACTVRDADGITVWSRISRRVKFLAYSSTGITEHKPAIVATKGPSGVLSPTVALEYETGVGQRFLLIHYPFAQQYSVVLKCRPTGGERRNIDDRNQHTTNWGGFGAALGNISTVAQYTVTVESAPRSQVEARHQMEGFIHDDAPEFAKQATRDRLNLGVSNHAGNTTWVTVTFNATEKGNSAKARQANALHVAQLLPGIVQRLSMSGAGRVTPVTEREAAEYVRAAVDPQARPIIEAAHAQDEDTGITWENCGPMSMKPAHDYLLHDGAVSQTLVMTRPPAGAVPDTILKHLLSPHPDIEIKRVTILKQVIDVGRAAVLTSRDVGNAEIRRQERRRSGTARREEQIAVRTADEHAEGHGLEDFTILVTVTVTDPNNLAHAVQTVRSQLGPGAAVRFRPAYAQQDTAFWLNCPFGFDPWAHSATETAVKHATTAH